MNASTNVTPPHTPESQYHGLRCMEIFGGVQSVDLGMSVPGIDAWIHSRPHAGDELGGDIHYVSSCGAGNIARFVIADVSGHGKTVSELAERLRELVRKHINNVDQTQIARALNEEFAALADTGQFATAVAATYFAPNDHLIVCNAGHPRPLWYRAKDQSWQLLQHDAPEAAEELMDLPLGVIPQTGYRQFAVPLSRGDVVLLYTDALIEASDEQGRQLGETGLLELVQNLRADDPAELQERTLAAVNQYTGHELDDDTTLFVLHHNASNPPRQSMGDKLHAMAKMIGLSRVHTVSSEEMARR